MSGSLFEDDLNIDEWWLGYMHPFLLQRIKRRFIAKLLSHFNRGSHESESNSSHYFFLEKKTFGRHTVQKKQALPFNLHLQAHDLLHLYILLGILLRDFKKYRRTNHTKTC